MIPLTLSLGFLTALLQFLCTPEGQKTAADWRAVFKPIGDGLAALIVQIQADIEKATKAEAQPK